MEKILEYVLSLVNHNLLGAMIGGGIIEQIIVPIPSPIISMAGGASLFGLNLSFLQTIRILFLRVSLPYAIGAVLGTSLIFFICFYGGKPFVEKFGRYIGISWRLIEKVQADFKKTISDELFILIGCSIPVVPVSLITAFCGIFKTKPIKFYPMLFLALLIRATILAFIGFKMGQTFTGLAKGLDKIESILTIIGAFLILGFLFLKREQYLKKNG